MQRFSTYWKCASVGVRVKASVDGLWSVWPLKLVVVVWKPLYCVITPYTQEQLDHIWVQQTICSLVWLNFWLFVWEDRHLIFCIFADTSNTEHVLGGSVQLVISICVTCCSMFTFAGPARPSLTLKLLLCSWLHRLVNVRPLGSCDLRQALQLYIAFCILKQGLQGLSIRLLFI